MASPTEFGPGCDVVAAEPNVWLTESYSCIVHDSPNLAAILLAGDVDLPNPLFAIPPAAGARFLHSPTVAPAAAP